MNNSIFRLIIVFILLFTILGAFHEEAVAKAYTINSNGLVQPMATLLPHKTKRLWLEGPDGVRFSIAGATIILESKSKNGALITFSDKGEIVLERGILNIESTKSIVVRMSEQTVHVTGTARLFHNPVVSTGVSVFKGSVNIDDKENKVKLTARDSIIFRSKRLKHIRSKLLPSPVVPSLPSVLTLPFNIEYEIVSTKSTPSALLVEISNNKNFWENSERHLYGPEEDIMIVQTEAGNRYFRFSYVNEMGFSGIPTKIYDVVVIDENPSIVIEETGIIKNVVQGKMIPPLDNIPLTFGPLRTFTKSGHFSFPRFSRPMGLYGLQINMDLGVRALTMERLYLSDPDNMTQVIEHSGENFLYVKNSGIFVSDQTEGKQLRVDGQKVPSGGMTLLLSSKPDYHHRVLIEGSSFEDVIHVLKDDAAPRIESISFEAVDTDRFYVVLDVLDDGVGMSYPVHSKLTNDAGEEIKIALNKEKGNIVKGLVKIRPSKRPAKLWWIHIGVSDILGNERFVERPIFEKKDKIFQFIGLKDLVRAWRKGK